MSSIVLTTYVLYTVSDYTTNPATILLVFAQTMDYTGNNASMYDNSDTVISSVSALPDLSELFKKVERSVVQITGNSHSNESGEETFAPRLGSGFVYDEQGYILTNNHVVAGGEEGKEEFDITFLDGSSYKAIMIGADPYADLAILKINNVSKDKLVPLEIGNSSSVTVGQRVVAIGNPFGLSGSMTEGIVSGLGRIIPSSPSESGPLNSSSGLASVFSIPNVIQTDAAINPGNSGGPLLNVKGEVIGINTAIFSNTGSYSGVGFAIPSFTLEKIIPSLINKGSYEHPYMGIVGIDVNSDIAKHMNLSESRGFLVTSTPLDGPADKAGIRGGDTIANIDGMKIKLGGDVIVGIDNTTVRKIDDILSHLEREKSVGDTVNLDILRDGKDEKVVVKLDARPVIANDTRKSSSQPSIGISGTDVTSEIAKRIKMTNVTGFLIIDVIADGPADKAGIRGGYKTTMINGTEIGLGGDVIVGIDNTTVRSSDDLQLYLMRKNVGEKVDLLISREGVIQKISVVLESKEQNDLDFLKIPPNSQMPPSPPHPYPPPFIPPGSSSEDVFKDKYNKCIKVLEKNICDKLFFG